jgi:competence protein ComEC
MQIRPIVGLACAYIVGIAVGVRWQAPVWMWLAAAAAAFLGLAWWLRPRAQPAALACVLVCAVALGVGRVETAVRVGPTDVSCQAWQEVTLRGMVADLPDVRERSILFTLDADAVGAGDEARPATGRVQVTLFGDLDRPPSYGDVIEAHGYLREPEPAVNPGGFSYRSYLAARGIRSVLSAGSAVVVERGRGSAIRRLALAARRHIERGVRRRLDPDRAAVLLGVMFGTRAGIDPDVQRDFETAGTVHILAASGLHAGAVALLVMWALGLVWVPRRWAALAAIAALIGYAFMAGLSPPIVRATVMFTMYAGARVFGRLPDGRAALAAAALALLVANPLALFDVGFQLSFVCVASMLYVMPLFGRARHGASALLRPRPSRAAPGARYAARVWRRVVALVLLTLSIQIGLAPLTAHYFGRIQWAGVLGNLVMMPAAMVMLGLGGLLGVLGWSWLGFVAERSVALVVGSVHWVALIPGAGTAVKPFGVWNTILYYAAIGAVVLWHGQRTQNQERTPGDRPPRPG